MPHPPNYNGGNMYKIIVKKTSDTFNKTFKGTLLKAIDVVEDLEKYFSKSRLNATQIIEALNKDADIELVEIKQKETVAKVEPKKEIPKKTQGKK